MVAMLWGVVAVGEELYFVDAHSQVGNDIGLEEIISLMQESGIRKTILSARKKRKPSEIADLAESHPDWVVAAIRTKGKHYKKNTPQYYKNLSNQSESGRFGAIAEVHIYHSKPWKGTHFELSINDSQVKAAFEVAKKNSWPFVIHIEFSGITGSKRERYTQELTEFLLENPEHPVALIHMGQLDATEVRSLILAHQNIYFLTSHSNSITAPLSKLSMVNMFNGHQLTQEWKVLLTDHPDRFIFALDNVHEKQWRNNYREQIVLWRNALGELSDSVAHAVAHKNAESLWRLEY